MEHTDETETKTALNALMTVPEINAEFEVAKPTIMDAIRRKKIPARQSGSTWLIRRVDVENRWEGREEKLGQ